MRTKIFFRRRSALGDNIIQPCGYTQAHIFFAVAQNDTVISFCSTREVEVGGDKRSWKKIYHSTIIIVRRRNVYFPYTIHTSR